ncbi:hypothetical protein HPB51_026181 [Rhipicephalus microplus]|uniref:TLC domain-containing protein n=1 Tax=Rhipicephalus microplus TaxID=6941 RepID=A0A9J6DRK5_RHIMP|nr:hypothetical protein HPB51_026181 [Rhipicephalus microplus]
MPHRDTGAVKAERSPQRLKEELRPLGWRLSLEPSNVAKLPESAWKLLYYGCVWLLTVYIVVLQGKYRFFQQPFSVWDGWSPEVTVPSDIWWIYAVQSSYYVHGMYAVLYQDLWRKDSAVMLAHHSLTLVLLGMSYTFSMFLLRYCDNLFFEGRSMYE